MIDKLISYLMKMLERGTRGREEKQKIGFDVMDTCTRERYIGEIERRERKGESGLQPNRRGKKIGINTPPQAGAWRSNMPSLDPMVSYAGPGRPLVKMSAS